MIDKILFSSINQLDQDFIKRFQLQERIEIQTQLFNWGSAWKELLQIALYNQGPDISEIGSTWIGSLLDMNAIVPLPPQVISLHELQQIFYPGAYMSILGANEKKIWGVPWLTDTRVIYFRRSALERAGIDEEKAFCTTEALKETLDKLQQASSVAPLTLPTADLNVIYNAASWVWKAGGAFRVENEHSLSLTTPATQAGLLEYFSLHPFLAPQARGLTIEASDDLFRSGDASTAISGPWLYKLVERDGKFFPDLGIAKIPAIPFVGGSHLVIWAHSLLPSSVLQKFIKFLTSIEIQSQFVHQSGLLPVRTDVLRSEPFANNLAYQVFADSLSTGRVFKISYRWAAVEQRIMNLMTTLWADLAKQPDLDLKKELYQRTDAVVARLSKTILAKP